MLSMGWILWCIFIENCTSCHLIIPKYYRSIVLLLYRTLQVENLATILCILSNSRSSSFFLFDLTYSYSKSFDFHFLLINKVSIGCDCLFWSGRWLQQSILLNTLPIVVGSTNPIHNYCIPINMPTKSTY